MPSATSTAPVGRLRRRPARSRVPRRRRRPRAATARCESPSGSDTSSASDARRRRTRAPRAPPATSRIRTYWWSRTVTVAARWSAIIHSSGSSTDSSCARTSPTRSSSRKNRHSAAYASSVSASRYETVTVALVKSSRSRARSTARARAPRPPSSAYWIARAARRPPWRRGACRRTCPSGRRARRSRPATGRRTRSCSGATSSRSRSRGMKSTRPAGRGPIHDARLIVDVPRRARRGRREAVAAVERRLAHREHRHGHAGACGRAAARPRASPGRCRAGGASARR